MRLWALFEARFCCGVDSELAAYFGDDSTNRKHKLRTKQQTASSNPKYIHIFKHTYFKWISFISENLVKKRKQSKSLDILSNKLSLSTSNSNFINLKYKCDYNCSRTVSHCIALVHQRWHSIVPFPVSTPIKVLFLSELCLETLTGVTTSSVSLAITCYLEAGHPLTKGQTSATGVHSGTKHNPHPKASTCFSYYHHTQAAIHLLGKKIGVLSNP